MTPAKISLGLAVLALAGALWPSGAEAAAQHAAPASATRSSTLVTPTDFSASRRHGHRMRHVTRVHIYRHGDYSFFQPYAPPVPPFFPFGYRQGYF